MQMERAFTSQGRRFVIHTGGDIVAFPPLDEEGHAILKAAVKRAQESGKAVSLAIPGYGILWNVLVKIKGGSPVIRWAKIG